MQRDLTGYFKQWEYPVSEEAVARIRAFGYDAWIPPGWPQPGDGNKQ